MATAGTIAIDFAAETARFRAQLDDVQRRMGRLENAFGQVGDIAKRFLGGLSVAAIGAFVQQAAAAADELGKTADRLNIGAEALKKFQVAAENTGVATAQANNLLQTAQKRLGEAAAGGGAAAKTLNTLGLSVKDLQRLEPDQLFLAYGDALGKLKDRNEQVAAATDLFGNSAADALTFILQGRDALASASEFVDKYGLALSRVQIGQIEAANDALGDLQKISAGVGQQLAVAFAPFVQAVAESLKDATAQGGALNATVSVLGGAGVVAVGIFRNTLHTLEAAFFAVAAGGARVLQFITFGDLSKSFEAAVTANLQRADLALQKIKSEKQIVEGLEKIFDDNLNKSLAAQEEARLRDEEQRRNARLAAQSDRELELAAKQFQLQTIEQLERDFRQRQLDDSLTISAEIQAIKDKEVAVVADRNARILEDERRKEEAILQLKQIGFDTASLLLSALAQRSKTFAKLQVAYNKAQSIAEAIQNTKVAVTAALKTGDPYSRIPRAIAIGAFGALQVAAIAKTGFNEVAAIDSSGGAPLGSPTNPVFAQDPSNAPGNIGSVPGAANAPLPGNAIQVVVNGNFFGSKETVDYLVDRLRDELNNKDVVLFSSTSQQALEIQR